jgi:hypothetical protein
MMIPPEIDQILATNTQLLETNEALRREIDRLNSIVQTILKSNNALIESNKQLLNIKEQGQVQQVQKQPEPQTQTTKPPSPSFGTRCKDLICQHSRCEELRKLEQDKDKEHLENYERWQKLMGKCDCGHSPKVVIRKNVGRAHRIDTNCCCGKSRLYICIRLSDNDIHYIKHAIIPLNPNSYIEGTRQEFLSDPATYRSIDRFTPKTPEYKPPKPVPKPSPQQPLRRSARLQKKQNQQDTQNLLKDKICPKCKRDLILSPSESYLKCNSCGFYTERANGTWKVKP